MFVLLWRDARCTLFYSGLVVGVRLFYGIHAISFLVAGGGSLCVCPSCGLVNRARSIELGCFFERVLWDLMRFVRNSVPLLPEIGSRVTKLVFVVVALTTNLAML